MAREKDTTGMNVGQPKDIILGDGTLDTNGGALELVTERDGKADYLDELAFMEEELIVMVHETTDENAENPVTVGCNGVFKQFFRGQKTLAKRKHVDCLIVKSARVSTPEIQNGAGERTYAIRQHNAHKFPFSIISDPSGEKGIEWFSKRMSEAV